MSKRPTAANAATPPPLISDKRLQHLYLTLLRCRLLRQRNRLKSGPASLVAREAIVTGTVTHLEAGDMVMPVAGDRLPALARGHALRRILTGAPLPDVLPDAPTAASRFSIATGYAMAQQNKKHIVLAFAGPGIATLEGLEHALAYAAKHKLGIIFVIETSAEADVSSARHMEPLGLYGIPVDGDDVVAIYRVAQEAMTRARRGLGPTLIDCKPWPLNATHDSLADPVRRLEQTLDRRGLWNKKLAAKTVADFKENLRVAAPRKKR